MTSALRHPYEMDRYPVDPEHAAPTGTRHTGRWCAVLAPVLLAFTVVPWAGAVACLLVGVSAAFDESGGQSSGQSGGQSGDGAIALAVILVVVAVALWFASVVLSIVGVSLARNAPRGVAGVTLAIGVGTMPVLWLIEAMTSAY